MNRKDGKTIPAKERKRPDIKRWRKPLGREHLMRLQGSLKGSGALKALMEMRREG